MKRRAALAALAFATAASAAPPLPEPVRGDFPGLREQGEGRLRFFGLHVYDAALWTSGPAYAPGEDFALDIRYAIAIKGSALTERSLEEMRAQGWSDEIKLQQWQAAMARVFPDLKPGDRLVGVSVRGRESRFYNQRTRLGVIADEEFTRAFFGIWLDERTREPALRERMLRKAPP